MQGHIALQDLPGPNEGFARDVLAGLSRARKTLPCRYFYDKRGSELFEDITRLPEYYPFRAELEILQRNATDMAAGVPNGAVLIEFGSGSSVKTELLLRELPQLGAYMAIDVSVDALKHASLRLGERFPWLAMVPVVADFSQRMQLSRTIAERSKVGFFPGSTIGNLMPLQALKLLSHFRALLGPSGRLLIGVDLKKDRETLERAYDDAQGVTAAFNLNILARINRELGTSIDLASFRHKALYNEREGRIEMHLVSLEPQAVDVLGHCIKFAAGESIHTENSYKYAPRQFMQLAQLGGWRPSRMWTDTNGLFSVHELTAMKTALTRSGSTAW